MSREDIRAQDHGESPRRRFAVVTVVGAGLLLLAVVFWLLLTLNPALAWGGDNAMYLMLARNLVEGTPYNLTGYIQNPYSYLAPTTYPPGFPLILAPLFALVGLKVVAFKIYVIAIFVLAVALHAAYCRTSFRHRAYAPCYVLALIPLVGLNPRLSSWTTLILSEGLFLVFVIGALWALRRAYERMEAHGPSWPLALLGGALVAFAISTRVYGVGLLASILIYELTRCRRLTPVGAYSLTSALVLWLAQTLWIDYISTAITRGAGHGYVYLIKDDFIANISRLPETMLANLTRYGDMAHQFWLPGSEPTPAWVELGVALSLVVACIGFVVQLRRRYTVLEVFCVVYFLGLLPWHAYGTRYLIPLVPFYFLYLLIGLAAIETWLRLRLPVLLIAALAVAAVAYGTNAAADARFDRRVSRSASNGPDAMQVYDYIRRHTPREAVFIARDPRVLALFTRRGAATYVDQASGYRLRDDQGLIDYFQSIGADYLLTSPYDPAGAARWLATRHPLTFHPVFRNQHFGLYRISKSPD